MYITSFHSQIAEHACIITIAQLGS